MPDILSNSSILSGRGGTRVALDGKIIEALLPWFSGSWSQLSETEVWGLVFRAPNETPAAKTMVYDLVSKTAHEWQPERPVTNVQMGRAHWSDEQGHWCIFEAEGTTDWQGRFWPHPAVPIGMNRNGVIAIKRDYHSGGTESHTLIDLYGPSDVVGQPSGTINAGEGWGFRLGLTRAAWITGDRIHAARLDGAKAEAIPDSDPEAALWARCLGTMFAEDGSRIVLASWSNPRRQLVLYTLADGPTKALPLTVAVNEAGEPATELAYGWTVRIVNGLDVVTGAGLHEGEPPEWTRVWQHDPATHNVLVRFADGREIQPWDSRDVVDATAPEPVSEPEPEPEPMPEPIDLSPILLAVDALGEDLEARLDEQDEKLTAVTVSVGELTKKVDKLIDEPPTFEAPDYKGDLRIGGRDVGDVILSPVKA